MNEIFKEEVSLKNDEKNKELNEEDDLNEKHNIKDEEEIKKLITKYEKIQIIFKKSFILNHFIKNITKPIFLQNSFSFSSINIFYYLFYIPKNDELNQIIENNTSNEENENTFFNEEIKIIKEIKLNNNDKIDLFNMIFMEIKNIINDKQSNTKLDKNYYLLNLSNNNFNNNWYWFLTCLDFIHITSNNSSFDKNSNSFNFIIKNSNYLLNDLLTLELSTLFKHLEKYLELDVLINGDNFYISNILKNLKLMLDFNHIPFDIQFSIFNNIFIFITKFLFKKMMLVGKYSCCSYSINLKMSINLFENLIWEFNFFDLIPLFYSLRDISDLLLVNKSELESVEETCLLFQNLDKTVISRILFFYHTDSFDKNGISDKILNIWKLDTVPSENESNYPFIDEFDVLVLDLVNFSKKL
jgi:hypothetical protein